MRLASGTLVALVLITGSTGVAGAEPGKSYHCSVTNYMHPAMRANEQDFITANTEKVFEIEDKGDLFVVTVKSATFDNETKVYRVTSTKALQVNAEAESRNGMDVMTISADPKDPVFNASIVNPTPAYVYGWTLKCASKEAPLP